MDRRAFVLGSAAAGATLMPAMKGWQSRRAAAAGPASGIADENLRPGSTTWRSDRHAAFLAASESPLADRSLEAMVGSDSVRVGEPISVHVSAEVAEVDVELYRLGDYRGAGGRLVARVAGCRAAVRSRPTAPDEPIDWPVTVELQTDTTVTGLHLVVVRPAGRSAPTRYVPVVVRATRPAAAILYHVPFATYQAYNAWGGASFYDYNSPAGRADAVSMHRPFDVFDGAGFAFYGELQTIGWLEGCGVDVEYVTSADLDADPGVLAEARVFVSAFHDEYWSTGMRDRLEAFVAGGGDAAFLGANSVYWRVALRDGVMSCDKSDDRDLWRRLGRPEHRFLGSAYESYEFPYGRGFDWVVTGAEHWLYAGTGVRDGDVLAGLVGYEWDRAPVLDRDGLTVLAASPIDDRRRHHAVVLEERGRGTVWNVGTNYWPRALVGGGRFVADPVVAQMTANFVARSLGV